MTATIHPQLEISHLAGRGYSFWVMAVVVYGLSEGQKRRNDRTYSCMKLPMTLYCLRWTWFSQDMTVGDH